MNILKDFSPNESLILLYMILKAGKDDQLTISLNQLAEGVGTTQASIIKALKHFKEENLLDVVKNTELDYHYPNSYIFLFDKTNVVLEWLV